MKFSNQFFVNGRPLLVPDENVKLSYCDLDDASSGRDESGLMHRFVARYKVPTWEFSYAYLTEQERRYLDSLFPNTPTFVFSHPGNQGEMEDTVCYRSQYAVSWVNARTGLWSGYGFTVIAC